MNKILTSKISQNIQYSDCVQDCQDWNFCVYICKENGPVDFLSSNFLGKSENFTKLKTRKIDEFPVGYVFCLSEMEERFWNLKFILNQFFIKIFRLKQGITCFKIQSNDSAWCCLLSWFYHIFCPNDFQCPRTKLRVFKFKNKTWNWKGELSILFFSF